MTTRPVLLFVPGPVVHFFRTTGMYYLYELAQVFDVVVLAHTIYDRDSLAQALFRLPSIREVAFLPDGNLPTIEYQLALVELCERLGAKWRPSVVLQHDPVFIHNAYIYRILRRYNPDCVRLTYLMAARLPVSEDLAMLSSSFIESAMLARGMSRLDALEEFVIKSRRNLWIEHFMGPRLIAGNFFVPAIHVNTGKLARQAIWEDCDGFLAYSNHDKAIVESDYPGGPPVYVVRHPLEVIGGELHEWLSLPAEEPIIAVMPSNGYLSNKVARLGGGIETVVRTAAVWSQALSLIHAKFPDCRIVWKAHPASSIEPLYTELVRRVREMLPALEEWPASHDGQDLAKRARVVVSDVSSSLWWAGLVDSKVAISLDLFDYRGGDVLRHVPQIHYFTSLDALEADPLHPRTLGLDADRPTASALIAAILPPAGRDDRSDPVPRSPSVFHDRS